MSASRFITRLAVFFGAVLLASCDAYIPASEHQARIEHADYAGWLYAKSEERDEVLREIGTVRVGHLKQGEEARIPLDVTGVHEALVIGACDRNCSDLDLRVITEDGRLLDFDEDEDARPRVSITAGASRKLMLLVRMPSCSSASCAYAFSQFEYEEYAGSTGSCFAVSPNGWLMTSLHVVDKASSISVYFPDGRRGKATLERSSTDNDLALLRTNIPTPVWLPFADVADVTLGMQAFAMGFPSPNVLGSEIRFTEGSVTALSGADGESTMLQVSIPIQPGSSGSPVLSWSGRVLGVIESTLESNRDGTPMQVANFARHAQVASLLLPVSLAQAAPVVPRSRQEAIARAEKAVCQVRGSR